MEGWTFTQAKWSGSVFSLMEKEDSGSALLIWHWRLYVDWHVHYWAFSWCKNKTHPCLQSRTQLRTLKLTQINRLKCLFVALGVCHLGAIKDGWKFNVKVLECTNTPTQMATAACLPQTETHAAHLPSLIDPQPISPRQKSLILRQGSTHLRLTPWEIPDGQLRVLVLFPEPHVVHGVWLQLSWFPSGNHALHLMCNPQKAL